jgi:hypothetical protein
VKSTLIFSCNAQPPLGSLEEHIFLSTFSVVSFRTPYMHLRNKPLNEFIDRLCRLLNRLNPKLRTDEFEDFAFRKCRGIEWMCRRGARSSGQWSRPACRQKEHSCAWKRDKTQKPLK